MKFFKALKYQIKYILRYFLSRCYTWNMVAISSRKGVWEFNILFDVKLFGMTLLDNESKVLTTDSYLEFRLFGRFCVSKLIVFSIVISHRLYLTFVIFFCPEVFDPLWCLGERSLTNPEFSRKVRKVSFNLFHFQGSNSDTSWVHMFKWSALTTCTQV